MLTKILLKTIFTKTIFNKKLKLMKYKFMYLWFLLYVFLWDTLKSDFKIPLLFVLDYNLEVWILDNIF